MSDGSSSGAQPGHSSAEGGSQLWRGLRQMLFGGEQETSLREQIEDAIAEHDDEGGPPGNGDLSPIERQMVRNLLHFGERTADDVGVPRSDIVAVPEDASFRTLVELFADAGHSRLPVFRGSLDTVVGMVHVKDVFAILAKGGPEPSGFAELIREPVYVPQSMGVLDLLAEMRTRRTHLAIVIDEYSGTEGLVTIEDLVEEIVGDIEDEHDDAPAVQLVEVEPGLWDADARVELERAGALIDPRLAEVEEDVDTLGGLALILAGHVPETGDMLEHDSGWRIEVVEADERRARRLRLHAPAVAEAAIVDD
ncbi:CBS domain containing-hemolysin-like protein [Sphingomonas jejuensis]|uniref:CBS domain containing-hemolysin-like protein n=1 Tax=Sphingomonas jejuensis TaxID=904715 RepID=A0ABX0XPF6_9SPHN|nr:hemolysin family protein [Sphingomonas jejuensis]NJC35261.1 CBS domain containing-hemolysin-like protein [Sphingomonas jejuensis]